MATASVEVYLFTPVFLTLTLFQGHWDTRRVKLQLKNGGGGGGGALSSYTMTFMVIVHMGDKIMHTVLFVVVFAFWIW